MRPSAQNVFSRAPGLTSKTIDVDNMHDGSSRRKSVGGVSRFHTFLLSAIALCAAGASLVYVSRNHVLSGSSEHTEVQAYVNSNQSSVPVKLPANSVKWAGNTIHSVVTSNGDAYQNVQTRTMYRTYQMVQKEPGGEHLTGFTRILHRTVPDMLMRIIPTYHAWDVFNPACDQWCEYTVANRPPAIQQWIAAASKDSSMIQGAWVLMIECDYVWLRPLQAPGNAYNASVQGIQFFFGYITPEHEYTAPWMHKLFPGGDLSKIPASGPAPALLRFSEWQILGPDYARVSAVMEADTNMTKALGWVHEMYAWNVAVAMHVDKVKITTLPPPFSTLIVQPPSDDALGNASMCHYTWGAFYKEAGPEGKRFYTWEKRDWNDEKFVIDVPSIPMPPEFEEKGWVLDGSYQPLTRARHNLLVMMLSKMNTAIASLPNIISEKVFLDNDLMPKFLKWKTRILKEREDEAEASAAAAATALLYSVTPLFEAYS